MDEEIIKAVVKQHWYSNFPKWLKVILLILSLITVVYWVGLAIYKILSAIRCVGAFIFEKRNYWTFLCCILILVIGGLLLAQFYFGLDPFGKFVEWAVETWDYLREVIANFIIGG